MTRYLTYPTCEWFVEAFGSAEIADWFAASEALDPVHAPSLAVQIPSLRSRVSDAQIWLNAFAAETALYAGRLVRGRAIGEMHWTLGRDPLPASWLESLFDVLASGFYLGRQPRLIASVDPHVAFDVLQCLIAKGFSRIDIGCHANHLTLARSSNADELPPVWQQHVLEQARRLTNLNVSIGIGLQYGVPGQTVDELSRLLDQVIALRPARVCCIEMPRAIPRALTAEAERIVPRTNLPMLQLATSRLAEAGYARVTSDTYALRGDVLEIAQRHGHLMMRPYGGSASAGTTTIALGPAAVGAVGPVHYQNHRGGHDYVKVLLQDRLPVMRGVSLSADDLIRRAVIHSLSCNLFVDIDALNLAYGIDFDQHFATEMPILAQLQQADLIKRNPDTIEIVGDGLLLVDSICSVFDAYLRRQRSSKPYTTLL